MYEEFLNYIRENGLITGNRKVLLAVSGGIDSMVMADLFARAHITMGIAHCNFSLRGEESDKDEEMVRRYAQKLSISFYHIRFRTLEYAENKGISIQMAARDLRYEWFEETRKKNGYDLVAVAHNLNDNIETLLINLTRGTGVAGLAGMKSSTNNIIRPLLFATRASIEEYQAAHNIEYREDKSNAETGYIRNKIRHLVIPVLKNINPSVEITLNETAERMSGINDIVSIYIDELRDKIFRQADDRIIADTAGLNPFLENKTIIFYESFSQLYQVRTCPPSHRILKNRNEIVVTEAAEKENECQLITGLSDLKKADGIVSVKIVANGNDFIIPADNTVACIDMKEIVFPVIIRKWKPGDFFYPLGMKQKKKLSDYLIDRKYSLADKEKVRVIESDGKIVWIIGERIDNRYKITSSTAKILVIKCKAV